MDVPSEVIEECKQGRPDAFEELIRLTQRDVYSLALRLTGNPDDAAEVTQETYIRLLRSIRSFRGEAKFSTWLYRIAMNVCKNKLDSQPYREARRSHRCGGPPFRLAVRNSAARRPEFEDRERSRVSRS